MVGVEKPGVVFLKGIRGLLEPEVSWELVVELVGVLLRVLPLVKGSAVSRKKYLLRVVEWVCGLVLVFL